MLCQVDGNHDLATLGVVLLALGGVAVGVAPPEEALHHVIRRPGRRAKE